MKLFKKKDKLQKTQKALNKVLKKYKLIQLSAVYNLDGNPFIINLFKKDMTKVEKRILTKLQTVTNKLMENLTQLVPIRKKIKLIEKRKRNIDA